MIKYLMTKYLMAEYIMTKYLIAEYLMAKYPMAYDQCDVVLCNDGNFYSMIQIKLFLGCFTPHTCNHLLTKYLSFEKAFVMFKCFAIVHSFISNT